MPGRVGQGLDILLDEVRLGFDILPEDKKYKCHALLHVFKAGTGGIRWDKVSYCPSAVQTLS
jgi:hypothetical protein